LDGGRHTRMVYCVCPTGAEPAGVGEVAHVNFRSLHRHLIAVATIVSVIVGSGMPNSVRAQCPDACGDFNCNGSVSSSDVLDLGRWLYQLVYPCLDSACWNVDGHDRVTARDLVYLTRSVFLPQPIIQCDSSGTELPVLPTAEFWVMHNADFPAGDSVVVLETELVHWAPLAGYSVAFQIRVDGALAEF
jgi:hypothetical protein